MVAHRRYASANGDALAGALTYALLISAAPFVALATLVLGGLGVSSRTVAALLHRAAGVVLPEHVAAAVDGIQPGPVALRVVLVAALLWGSLRLVRALRTGVRAMCGQPAGSGNPVRDAARDVLLGVVLLAAMAVATVATALAAGGSGWGVLLSLPVLAVLLATAMVRCSWRGDGRPRWPAALRAAAGAAVALHVLTVAAGPYFAAASALHATLYRSAGAVVGVLVWCNMACRIVLRAAAWASTADAVPAPVPTAVTGPLWVVVPAYNEATSIGATLGALALQTDLDFSLVVVDNASTDSTAELVRRFGSGAPFPVTVLDEAERGAGTAADAGFRYAVAHGAVLLARTDADCLPAPDWVARAKALLAGGAELICGRSVPRRDEQPTLTERYLFPAAVRMAAWYGRLRPAHRRPEYRAPYVLCHGHNLAITADLYLRCGGTSRIPLHAGSEDVELLNRARRHTDRIVRDERLVVYNSLRRLRAWGPRRTLLWYWDRRYLPAHEDAAHVREVAA
nr:YhjD/YihY/BrkB family envelope integrity protein [Planosporangium mesophilum]